MSDARDFANELLGSFCVHNSRLAAAAVQERDPREPLLDDMAAAETAMRHASEWARRLAGEACQSGCHMAAVHRLTRADSAWRAAQEALDDHDYPAEVIGFHHGLVSRLGEAWAASAYPSELQASLDRVDHLLGEGWLEEGERYWAAHYAARG